MIVAIIASMLWSLIPGFMAQKKGRNFWGYYFLSFLITPLITIIIVACLSNISKEPQIYTTPPPPKSNTHQNVDFCENCGANISNDVSVCHVCGFNKKNSAEAESEQDI